MHSHPATTKVIKAGRSKNPILLFFGNRKRAENEAAESAYSIFTTVFIVLAAAVLCICLYAFLSGKLG